MSKEHRNALPQGYQLDDYIIEGILGAGGFGITYLAQEQTLNRKVAIKEFLPRDLAVRGEDGSTIHPVSSTDVDDFEYGLERFRDEARTLVNFRHPNIIPVHRLMETNGTAYLVMEYEDGDSLQEIVDREGTLSEDRIKAMILPILEGLEQVHQAGFLHRDIKPGNIYVRSDGSPVLIDFGAARQALGAKSRSMTAVVSVGYAPMEQYSVRGKQSAATDIYGLGATAYRAATGKRPPDAVERIEDDPYVSAAEAAKGEFSPSFLAAIDWATRTDAKARPQSIAEWRAALEGQQSAPAVTAVGGDATTTSFADDSAVTGRPDGDSATAEPVIGHTLIGGAGDGSPTTSAPTPPSRGGRSKVPAIIGGALALLITASAGAGGWLWYDANESAGREAEARAKVEQQIVEEAGKRRKAEKARRRALLEVQRRSQEEARRRAAEQRRQAELERQRREEAERQRQAELERERKSATERRRLAEQERRRRAERERLRREQEARRRPGTGNPYRLTVINRCNRVSRIFVAYRVRGADGRWLTRGWLRVNRGGTVSRRLETRNRVVYLYAEGGGLRWSGRSSTGAIRRWVRSQGFAHSTGRLAGAGAKQVWFLKKTIRANTTGYTWSLICTR